MRGVRPMAPEMSSNIVAMGAPRSGRLLALEVLLKEADGVPEHQRLVLALLRAVPLVGEDIELRRELLGLERTIDLHRLADRHPRIVRALHQEHRRAHL